MGSDKRLFVAGIFFALLIGVMVFILADTPITVPDGTTTQLITEDADNSTIINITIDNSLNATNITMVNITIPSSFTFVIGTDEVSTASLENRTVFNSSFSQIGNTLVWANVTGTHGMISNHSNVSINFNITAWNPGIFNITVETYNNSALYTTGNITMNVQQPAGVQITFGDGSLESTNGTINASAGNNFVLNVSINNTHITPSSNISTINITITEGLSNVAGTDQVGQVFSGNVTNSSFAVQGNTLVWANTTGVELLINASANVSTFAFNVSVGANGLSPRVNITVEVYNKTARMFERNLTLVVLDMIRPEVDTGNFSSNTVMWGNYSTSNLILNVSLYDYGVVNTVIFNVTNSTGGGLNASYSASNYSKNQWNASLPTTAFRDGLYHVSVFVNDTSGNFNETVLGNLNVTFDNTAPEVSYSCSPSTVDSGGTTTCTCGYSDMTFVNYTSYTLNPSTSSTGTYTIDCSVEDSAGNTASTTTTYTVELSGTGSSSSSSSGGGSSTPSFTYSKTIPQNSKEFSEVGKIETSTFSSGGLKAKERVKIKINSEEHHVGVREVTETSATVEIASEPVQVKLDVGEDAKVDVNDDSYYDVYVKLNGITNSVADLTIEYLQEEIPEDIVDAGKTVETTGEDVTPTEEIPEEEVSGSLTYLYWVVGIIIVLVIAVVWIKKKR